jgi:hypothetical protein
MSVYRNRACLANGNDVTLSLNYPFKCDTKFNRGCKFGYLVDHLNFVEE